MTDWIDGRMFLRWLESRGHDPQEMDPGQGSTPAKWRAGEKVSVFLADEILTRLGYHLSELPDEFWTSPPSNRLVQDKALVRRVRSQYKRNPNYAEVGRENNVSGNTVKRWVAA